MFSLSNPSHEQLLQAARAPRRLAAIDACVVLDTAAEECYDNLAKLAAHISGAPLAAVSILHAERQWFKASVGTDVRQTGAAESMCLRTLLGPPEFITGDIETDERMKGYEPPFAFRAYAGFSIVAAGERVGTCCVLDGKPREWTKEQIDSLRMMARQVSALLEARVTANKLRAAQEQLDASTDTQAEMLARLDAHRRITFANAALCRQFGLTREQMVGRDVLDFTPPDEQEAVKAHFERILTSRKSQTTEQTIIDAHGRTSIQRWTDSPVLDAEGYVVGFQSWGWDVSELRKHEQALEAAHARMASTCQELSTRNAEILQLTFALTHDLQTPLATLTGQFNLLEQALARGEAATKPIMRMRSSVDRLTRMLTDLMAYAQAGHEQTRSEPIDLAAIARSVVDELANDAADKQVLLGFDEVASARSGARGTHIVGDKEALRRAICNLVINAVKYTSQRKVGEKRVIVRAQQSEQRVRLCIVDTGPGIPPAMLEQVFLPFKRVSRDASGTGLGLSIVKRYVEMFEGRVWLESDGKTGTTAVIEFKHAQGKAKAA